jgi:Yip1-like protein
MQSAYAPANRGLIDRAKNILATPKTEWPIIQAETTDAAQLYTGYVIPLAAFSAVMSFIHMSLIGVRYWHMPVLTGLVYALANFGFALLGIYLLGLIIDALAPSFAGQRNQRQALKTAAYAFTPAALSAVLGLLPAIGLLSALRVLLQLIACLYGIYLLYLGLPVLMRSPQEKVPGYTTAVVVCIILLGAMLGLVVSTVVRMTGYSPYPGAYGVHG